MARVLLTGLSDAGQEHPSSPPSPARRGYPTVDTDYLGWELPGAMWDEPRVSALLAEHTAIAVSQTAQNQGRFYDRFDQVIYLRSRAGGAPRPGAHRDQRGNELI